MKTAIEQIEEAYNEVIVNGGGDDYVKNLMKDDLIYTFREIVSCTLELLLDEEERQDLDYLILTQQDEKLKDYCSLLETVSDFVTTKIVERYKCIGYIVVDYELKSLHGDIELSEGKTHYKYNEKNSLRNGFNVYGFRVFESIDDIFTYGECFDNFNRVFAVEIAGKVKISNQLLITDEIIVINEIPQSELYMDVEDGQLIWKNCGKRRLSGDIVIPAGITEIPDSFFSNKVRITGVTIPDGVTKICDGAFSGCERVKYFKVPKSVKDIGSYAFESVCCRNLNMPGVENIETEAFYYATGLNRIRLSDNVRIGKNAFMGCDNLKTPILPKNAKVSMHPLAFYDSGRKMNVVPFEFRKLDVNLNEEV